MNKDDLSILIPIYNLSGDRLDNFIYILKKIVQSNITRTVLIYEQVNDNNIESKIKKLTEKYDTVIYKSEVINDDRIHKSFLINKGVDFLDTEFIWVNDADCYLKFKRVYNIISTDCEEPVKGILGTARYAPSIMDTHDFIQPFAVAKRLTKYETEKLRKDEEINVTFTKEEMVNNKENFIKLYGALSFIFRKSAFIEIGRMDETFTGWGLEDTEFCARVYKYCTNTDTKTSNIKILRTIAAVHLYHPMPNFSKRKNECPIYQKNFKYFTDKHGITWFKLRQYIESYHKKRPQITIINRPRTGSNCLKEALASGLKLPNESEPFADRHRYRYTETDNLNEAIEQIVSKQHIITHNLSTIQNKKAQFISTNKLISYSDMVVILTRKNFLDWATSMAIARHERNYYGRQYKDDTLIEIDDYTFNQYFTTWYVWHVEEVQRYRDICKEKNIPVIVADFDMITKLGYIRTHVLSVLDCGIDNDKFEITTVKQKTKTNREYIKNYDEIEAKYRSIISKEKTKLFEEISDSVELYKSEIF